MNFVTIPIIVVACYGLIELIKKTPLESKWYPVLSGAIGSVLAVLLYFIAPEIVGMTSPWAALVGGLASGLAATGTNQVFKQLMNGETPQTYNDYPYQDYNYNYKDDEYKLPVEETSSEDGETSDEEDNSADSE